jgi:hypothetical protein
MDQLPSQLATNLEAQEQVLVRFTRLAQTAFGLSYYLVPEVSSARPDCAPQEGVQLIAGSSWGFPGATAADIRAQTSDFRPMLQIGGGVPPTTFPAIVPDGVATATVRYPAGKAGGFDHKQLGAATVTARAVGNVIVLRVPRGGLQADAGTTTLRTSNGQIISTTTGV